MIEVAIVNASNVVTDAEAAATVAALQIQTTRDFFPIWGIDAHLTFVGHGSNVPTGHWQLVILDNSDQSGALGYHDITRDGQPLGKIFAGTDKRYGLSWSVTASHELFEMLVDPWVNLTVFAQSGDHAGRLYAYEVCDACEDDSFGYKINNILVSDFVFPAWFESWRGHNSTKFDFQNHITAPFQLLKGGYIGYFDIHNGGGWKQITAENAPNYKSRAPVGCRRERRMTDRNLWQHSTV